MADKEVREAALRRRGGQSEAHRAAQREVDEAATWKGTCKKCGKKLTGTLKELRSHGH